MQRVMMNPHCRLLFSLYRKSLTHSQLRPMDILNKLILSRSLQIISYSIQLVLNIEAVQSLSLSSANSTLNSKALNTSTLVSNIDLINQSGLNGSTQISLKNSLDEYLNDLLRNKKLTMNEIVSSITGRKNFTLVVNQQLKHVFQWIVDTSLNLVSFLALCKFNNNLNSNNNQNNVSKKVNGLVKDSWFLNELRKGLVFIKLVFFYNSIYNSNSNTGAGQQSQQNSFLISTSLPVLPLRSASQKDILSEIFNVLSKLIEKLSENSDGINQNIF
jgi:hypothetical protein